MTEENNKNLQDQENPDNISNAQQDNGNTNAGDNTPEDTLENPFEAIIEQQQSTINALLERTESLTGQINQLLQMGVQINTTVEPETTPDSNSLPDDYVTLSDLGAQFGKRE